MLADRVSREFFDPVTLPTLRCIGFVKGSQSTLAAGQMLSETVRRAFAA
jgi:hypothetical protein